MSLTDKRMLRRSLALAIAMALLATAALSIVSAGGGEIILWGGPGSVTINGKPAPPGTYVWAGLGPDPQEFPNIERVADDGSWQIRFSSDWERVHLYVDGFRVPGGPWDETVPGTPHETRLAVGADTDPEPVLLNLHAKLTDITLFGDPVPPNAKICIHVNDEWYACSGAGTGSVFTLGVEAGLRGITFTVNGFPVAGPSLDALPELAPFWTTIHAGDPKHPPFEFYGQPGDVAGATSNCEGDDKIFVHAIGDGGWEFATVASVIGSWSIKAPSGTTGIRIYASGLWHTHERYIPTGSETYVAIPFGGSREVELGYRAPGWYILPVASWEALTPGESRVQRFVFGLMVGRWNGLLDWAWFAASESLDGPGLWLTSFAASGRDMSQRMALPELASNPLATPCTARMHMQPSQRAMAAVAFLLERSGRLVPLGRWWSDLDRLLVWQLLLDQRLAPR